jgi:hypothetical protein
VPGSWNAAKGRTVSLVVKTLPVPQNSECIRKGCPGYAEDASDIKTVSSLVVPEPATLLLARAAVPVRVWQGEFG